MLTLSGCATFTQPTHATWTTQGRLAGQHHHDGFSANFFYAQTQQGFDLQLLGPLGMHPIRVVQTKGQVTAYFEGQRYTAHNAESLVYDLTSWELPVHFLSHWLHGKPAPAPKATQHRKNPHGRLVHFVQAGWNVELTYTQQTLHKMILTNPPWRLKVLLHPSH